MNMKKYRTAAEYKTMARNMGAKELVALAETFNECQSLGVKDIIIRDILNDEVERRIANWEIAQV
jgi:hypothetical protein